MVSPVAASYTVVWVHLLSLEGDRFCGACMFCPACLFLKILEFVSVVYRLLAAVDAGLPSQRHAVVSCAVLSPFPNNVASPPGSESEAFDTHARRDSMANARTVDIKLKFDPTDMTPGAKGSKFRLSSHHGI